MLDLTEDAFEESGPKPHSSMSSNVTCQDWGADFGERFGRYSHQGWVAERKKNIVLNHELGHTEQAKAPGISHSSLYYVSKPGSGSDLKQMDCIDHLDLELPFADSRILFNLLDDEGFDVCHKHVNHLDRKIGITGLYPKPRMTK